MMATALIDDTEDLPAGWRWATLGELADFMNGAAFKPTDWGVEGKPIIRIQNLTNPNAKINRTLRVVADKYAVEQGDLLVSWSATLDVFIWKREPAWLNQHIFLVRPDKRRVDPRYLYYLLKHEIEVLKKSEHLHGSTMMHINRKPFLAHSFPFPPNLETQRRIVTRIDELFSELDDGKELLRRARADVGIYRRALLRSAVHGELSANWRNHNRTGRTGRELLDEMLASRRRRLGRQRYVEPPSVDEANLFDLPDGWAWTTVAAAGDVLLGRQRAPVHHAGDHMRPYLRVANVLEGRLDLKDVKEMNFTPREFETFALRDGDVLLNEGQSPEFLGRPAVYRGEIEGCCFQKTLLRFRPSPSVLPDFALIVFRHYMHSGRFRRESRITTNIGHLTQVRFLPMEFPLAPLEEQAEVVAQFQEAEAAWHEHELDHDLASPLRQSILAAAFRGELVQ